MKLTAPFPYFGNKRSVAEVVWSRLGQPKQYIEPFCGSAAVLLAAPAPAKLEVVNDWNGFIANFWRAVKHQPDEVARAVDYPVSHIDQMARHRWLMGRRDVLAAGLVDPEWPGDARAAGWWLWGQCSWIGTGWCEWDGKEPVPLGTQVFDAGRGIQAAGKIPQVSDAGMLTSSGAAAWDALHRLAARLERVRILHGDWHRCLNHHYGGDDTAVFLDPPYRAYEGVYRAGSVADAVEAWARENAGLRVALCGHIGDYDLPGWEVVRWKRPRLTYSGAKTTDKEAIWFSPACLRPSEGQISLFREAP